MSTVSSRIVLHCLALSRQWNTNQKKTGIERTQGMPENRITLYEYERKGQQSHANMRWNWHKKGTLIFLGKILLQGYSLFGFELNLMAVANHKMQMMVPYSKDNVVDYCKNTENFDPSLEHYVAAEKFRMIYSFFCIKRYLYNHPGWMLCRQFNKFLSKVDLIDAKLFFEQQQNWSLTFSTDSSCFFIF